MESTPEEPVEDTVEERNVNFVKELKWLINKYSIENGSNTPDFIVADYLFACLQAFNGAATHRDTWYDVQHFKKGCDTLAARDDEDMVI